MTGDRTSNKDPEAGTAQPAGASRAETSMDELSRRLGERLAQQRARDPAAAAAARRAALQAYDQARERRLIAGLSIILALTVAAAVSYFVSTIDSQPVPRLASATTPPEPAASLTTAGAAPDDAVPVSAAPASVAPESVAPASAAPETPAPAARVADTPAVEAASAPVADSQPPPVAAPPGNPPLARDEVWEIQAKLRSFGFNPGPVDGTAGRMTEAAVRRYQQDRGQLQTGAIDRALLEQLRQDSARPVVQQVAQRAPGPNARSRSPAPRRADPFEPVRAAGHRFGQWLDSLVR